MYDVHSTRYDVRVIPFCTMYLVQGTMYKYDVQACMYRYVCMYVFTHTCMLYVRCTAIVRCTMYIVGLLCMYKYLYLYLYDVHSSASSSRAMYEYMYLYKVHRTKYPCMMYIVLCTILYDGLQYRYMYIVHTGSSLYDARCTRYYVQGMYIVPCTSYLVQGTSYKVPCTLYDVHRTMYIVRCT